MQGPVKDIVLARMIAASTPPLATSYALALKRLIDKKSGQQ